MTKSRLVIFDICGTLFFSNTSFDFLDLIVQAKSYSLFRKVSKTIFANGHYPTNEELTLEMHNLGSELDLSCS